MTDPERYGHTKNRGWQAFGRARGPPGCRAPNSARVSPADDVGKADQPVEERGDNERLLAMNLIAFAGHLEMLDDRFGADTQDDRGLGGGLAARGPHKTLALAIAEHGNSFHAARRTKGKSATERKRTGDLGKGEAASGQVPTASICRSPRVSGIICSSVSHAKPMKLLSQARLTGSWPARSKAT